MATFLPNTDCKYFLLGSNCAKGDACAFRHCAAARSTSEVCEIWRAGLCEDPDCTLRHFEDTKNRSKEMCYFESQPDGCTKAHCPYAHTKPRALPAAAPAAVQAFPPAASRPAPIALADAVSTARVRLGGDHQQQQQWQRQQQQQQQQQQPPVPRLGNPSSGPSRPFGSAPLPASGAVRPPSFAAAAAIVGGAGAGTRIAVRPPLSDTDFARAQPVAKKSNAGGSNILSRLGDGAAPTPTAAPPAPKPMQQLKSKHADEIPAAQQPPAKRPNVVGAAQANVQSAPPLATKDSSPDALELRKRRFGGGSSNTTPAPAPAPAHAPAHAPGAAATVAGAAAVPKASGAQKGVAPQSSRVSPPPTVEVDPEHRRKLLALAEQAKKMKEEKRLQKEQEKREAEAAKKAKEEEAAKELAERKAKEEEEKKQAAEAKRKAEEQKRLQAEAKKKAEEERLKKEEEEKKAEEERKAAEAKAKRLEEERVEAERVAKLKELARLNMEKKKAEEEARRRAEEAKRQAEKAERERLEKEKQEAARAAERERVEAALAAERERLRKEEEERARQQKISALKRAKEIVEDINDEGDKPVTLVDDLDFALPVKSAESDAIKAFKEDVDDELERELNS